MDIPVIRQLTKLVAVIRTPASQFSHPPSPNAPTHVNSYIIGSKSRRFLVDCGHHPAVLLHLKTHLESTNSHIQTLLYTHQHTNHVSNAGHILSNFIGTSPSFHKLPRPTDDIPKALEREKALRFLKDNQKVTTPDGDATLRVIATPGHASDHACYYLEEEEVLITGDAVASASLEHGGCRMNPTHAVFEDLDAYMASLKRLKGMVPRLVFPGHGEAVMDGMKYISDAMGVQESIAADMVDLVRTSPVPLTTNDVVSAFCQRRGIEHSQDVLAMKGTLRMHLLKLEKDGVLRRRQVAKDDTARVGPDGVDPSKVKGPGGLTMQQIYGHVQASRRRDWDSMNDEERKVAVKKLQKDREPLHFLHGNVVLGGDISWVLA
ncbi:Beta-lactamase-like protein 2 [Borealophlyctis nickersoniae]|nr:Beta-lactamase-like protein 2 [Borealophlyctis nickersoniae]